MELSPLHHAVTLLHHRSWCTAVYIRVSSTAITTTALLGAQSLYARTTICTLRNGLLGALLGDLGLSILTAHLNQQAACCEGVGPHPKGHQMIQQRNSC